MPCNHRFLDALTPAQPKLEYLFIGTFNPSWDADNGDNALWFYGRRSNQFWCILPHALLQHCLIDKDAETWKAFCDTHRVGITDLIASVKNADEDNGEHFDALTVGFEDRVLDEMKHGTYLFELAFRVSEIKAIIDQHRSSLKGVFFTRNSFQGIPRIWQRWLTIQAYCEEVGLHCQALPSPSPRGNKAIRDKIVRWRDAVQQVAKAATSATVATATTAATAATAATSATAETLATTTTSATVE